MWTKQQDVYCDTSKAAWSLSSVFDDSFINLAWIEVKDNALCDRNLNLFSGNKRDLEEVSDFITSVYRNSNL